MRVVPVAVLAALVIPAVAASWEPAETRVEDPHGDVQDGIQPVGHTGAGDIEAAWLETDGARFVLGVEFVEWPEGDIPFRLNVTAHFNYGGRAYVLEDRRVGPCDPRPTLSQVEPVGSRHLDCIEATVDEAAGVVEYTIPAVHITDSRDLPIHGRAITDFRVESEYARMQPLTDHGTWRDRAPDEGVADPLPIVMLEDEGPVRFVSMKPVLSTNGERSTHIWGVNLVNDLDTSQEFLLTTQDVPEGWQVFHRARWSVERGGVADIAVAATVPSQHVHGEEARFRLVALDAKSGATVAEIELGLRWLEVPQPTRHHPDLFLHVGDEPDRPWMNAAADDEGATGDRLVKADPMVVQTPYPRFQQTGSWQIPEVVMSPKLFEGLQFDLNRTVKLVLPVQWNGDTDDGSLRIVMSHCETGVVDRRRDGGCTNPETGQSGGEWQIIDADLDGLEFRAGEVVENVLEIPLGENLVSRVNASDNVRLSISWRLGCGECFQKPNPDGDQPWIDAKAFRLRLPLLEYADEMELSLRSLADMDVTASHELRRANPGDRVVFPLQIHLHNGTSGVEGSILGFSGSQTELVMGRASQGMLPAWAVVEVDGEAVPGTLLDGAVMLQSSAGSAAIRLQVDVVDPEIEDIASDPMPDPGGKNTPALGLFAVLAMLWLVRRRV